MLPFNLTGALLVFTGISTLQAHVCTLVRSNTHVNIRSNIYVSKGHYLCASILYTFTGKKVNNNFTHFSFNPTFHISPFYIDAVYRDTLEI